MILVSTKTSVSSISSPVNVQGNGKCYKASAEDGCQYDDCYCWC